MSITQKEALLAAASPAGTTLSVTAADLGANCVTNAALNFYVGHGKTGTGSSQNIAHGLSGTPSCLVIFEGSTSSQAVTYGTNTSTNVVCTVTSGATFTVFAWL